MPVIPIYRERVSTPTPPEPALAHAVPTQDYLSQTLVGLGEAGQKLQDILTIQKDHAAKLKVAQITNDFQRDLADDEVAAKAQPGTEWGATFLAAGTTRYNELLADPKNADVADTLKLQLPGMLSSGYKSLVVSGASQTEAEQQAQLKALGSTYTGEAGASYDPKTFEDTPAAQDAMDKYMGLVVDQWPNNPKMQDALMLQAIKAKELARARDVAVHYPELIGKFLDAHPGIPIQDTLNLRNMAVDAIKQPMQDIGALNEGLRAQKLQEFDAAQKAGTLSEATVQNAVAHNFIEPGDYARYFGKRPEMPSEPGARESIETSIKGAAPEDLGLIAAMITGNPRLSARDKNDLDLMVRERQQYVKTTVGKARRDAEESIDKAFDLDKINRMMVGFSYPGGIEALRRSTKNAYLAATVGEMDPDKIRSAADEAVKKSSATLSTIINPPKAKPSAKVSGAPASRDELLKAAEEARKERFGGGE